MTKRKCKTVRNDEITKRHYGMAQLSELYDRLSDISQEGICFKFLKSNREFAAEIKQTIAILNKQINVAKERGIIVNLQTNLACMADCSPLQAEIYERRDL